jgi:catechol 2,3-dioxygenase-like lactoylglutathione lyase family enzyme
MSSAAGQGIVTGIFHAVVVVSSMDRALAFYRDLLGMTVTFDAEHDPGSIRTLLGIPDARVRSVVVSCPDGSEIELAEYLSGAASIMPRRFAEPGINLLSLRVEGIEELIDRLEQAGYAFTSPLVRQPLLDGRLVKVAVCLGPDATPVTLTELPDERRSLGGLEMDPVALSQSLEEADR